MNLKIFGLSHLAHDQKSAINLSIKNFHQQVLTYVKNAITFSKSLALNNVPYALSNNKSLAC